MREAVLPAPRLGQHTREVLAEAGYGDAEIDRMLQTGAAIGTA
jgi:crotonobetainyl-CoA:carnitine CoA-transferase CaiB-like acyl-CoA transferase